MGLKARALAPERLNVVPLITYRSGPFFFSGAEAGVVAAQSHAYTLSFGLVPQLNRVRASDSPELAGIQTREWTIDGSLNLSIQQPWGTASCASGANASARTPTMPLQH